MTQPDRRTVLAALAALAWARPAHSRAPVVDAAGRSVAVPDGVSRIFPAGPPAAILAYSLAPDLLLGWTRAPTAAERAFLLPDVGARPEVGRLTGRGNTANLEVVLAARPDLILDVGSVGRTYVELADRVQAQSGIPYLLLDGRFAAIPQTYRLLGEVIGRPEAAEALAAWAEDCVRIVTARASSVPVEKRPKIYFARGADGLTTGLGGSINVETLEVVGVRNVAAESRGGLATVSIEQILRWDPDVVITIDEGFATRVRTDPAWAAVRAVRENRVHVAPQLPFGWIDFPPSVNRLIGLWWIGKVVYPELFPEDLRPIARDFYRRFYHVDPTDAQLDGLLRDHT